MNITIKGFHDKQKEIAEAIINSTAKFHTINASRQSGKSYLLGKLMVYFALKYKEDIMLVSPDYSKSKRVFDNILKINNIFNVISNVTHSKPYEIEFFNSAKIEFKSADRPDGIRSGTYKYVFVDEFAFIKSDVFNTAIRPTTAAKVDSKIIGVSTPFGVDNEFYELCELGKDIMAPNYEYYFMHYKDNPYYDLNEIEDAKIRLPRNIFNQEYEAEFITGSCDVFDDLDRVCVLDNFEPYNQNERYYAGIDFGRVDDKTVLTILNQNRDVVFIKDWNRMDWTIIVNELAIYLNRYKPITYAESNGVGDPLIPQLKQLYRNIREFMTTNQSKQELVENLRLIIFKQEIKLPTKKLYPLLMSEMASFTYSMSKMGNIQYHHKEGHYDDCVDSLMIANYAYTNHNKGVGTLIHKKTTIY